MAEADSTASTGIHDPRLVSAVLQALGIRAQTQPQLPVVVDCTLNGCETAAGEAANASEVAIRAGRCEPGPTLIYGPAGIGKTVLAKHIAAVARADNPDLLVVPQNMWALAGSVSQLVGVFSRVNAVPAALLILEEFEWAYSVRRNHLDQCAPARVLASELARLDPGRVAVLATSQSPWLIGREWQSGGDWIEPNFGPTETLLALFGKRCHHLRPPSFSAHVQMILAGFGCTVQPWSPATHHWLPRQARARVITIMLCRRRVDDVWLSKSEQVAQAATLPGTDVRGQEQPAAGSTQILPHLPIEMWLAIVRFTDATVRETVNKVTRLSGLALSDVQITAKRQEGASPASITTWTHSILMNRLRRALATSKPSVSPSEIHIPMLSSADLATEFRGVQDLYGDPFDPLLLRAQQK
eukprot:m.418008 g.418008  ORF g.418008 m.418008 type:complete len:413 (+) comp16834_c0_seq62:2179-3417(+)